MSEWTVERVAKYFSTVTPPDRAHLRDMARAINAALAAERKAHEMDGQLISSQEVEIHALRERLAAERSKVRPAIFDPEHYPEDRITQLEQQLAAERERRERDEASWKIHYYDKLTEIQQLRKQLAAEREKVQTYEGALIKIANDPNCDRCQVAVNALAKVAK